MNDRREQDAAIADLHRRMDDHEKLIKELCAIVRESIVVDKAHNEALEQMIVLWRGSKIVIPALMIFVPTFLALIVWFREHVKL